MQYPVSCPSLTALLSLCLGKNMSSTAASRLVFRFCLPPSLSKHRLSPYNLLIAFVNSFRGRPTKKRPACAARSLFKTVHRSFNGNLLPAERVSAQNTHPCAHTRAGSLCCLGECRPQCTFPSAGRSLLSREKAQRHL